VENHTAQLNQLGPKVENLHSAMEEVDRKLDSITLSCEICRKDIQSERVWRSERIGNAVDWAIKGIALILIVIMGIFYAWKMVSLSDRTTLFLPEKVFYWPPCSMYTL